MADNSEKTSRESLRETIQIEREQLREKIRELIDSEYEKLEAEAEKIAPEFDYEAETEALKEEEAEELDKRFPPLLKNHRGEIIGTIETVF